ncbi:MAG: hypothetical protein NC181_01895 [Clostridium sp.]|nr:hypothetical protein [Clostridium sp.]MCM1444060.1 hypothetical protein [Candidatus Amulumruptor caecigallinarius]
MNENIETLNVEENEKPMIEEIEPAEFSDDFFDQDEDGNEEKVQETKWNDDAVLNAVDSLEKSEPIVTNETVKDDFVTLESKDDEEKTSDFDAFFDSLYDDVEGANNLISQIIEKKKTIKEDENTINQTRENLEKERLEFQKFVDSQKESLELEKKQFEESMKLQKERLLEEEQEIKSDAEVKNRELNLKENAIKIEREKLDADKEQFGKYKETEESKLNLERERIANEEAQLEKDTALSLQTIENEKKDLETEKEHFNQQKEAEEKKIAFERESLAQSCAKFKQLVSQFNNNFSKLPENK